jgi:tetratricopeptide (TPR) repeat protein
MFYRIIASFLFIFPILSGCSSLAGNPQGALLEKPATRIYPLVKTTPIEKDPVYQLVVAELAVNRGQTKTAIDNYLALAIGQNDPKLAERAVRIAVFGQDLSAAQIAAERWIELEPEKVEAQQIIAAIFIRQENAEQAFYYLDEVIKAHNEITDQTFISLLSVLAREQNTETVLNVSRKLADKYNGYAYAQFLHGNLASRANLAQESLDYLDNALAIKDIPDAHAIRAKMLINLGQREEAVISLKRAVLSKPQNKELRLAYARLLVDMKEYERARIEFEKLHLLAPNDPDLLYTLGLLSLESQRFDAAEKYLSKLLTLNKRTGEAQYYLGRINESRNQYQQAIDWYQKVQTGEYRFDAHIRTANLMAKAGNTDDAINQLKQMAEGSQSKASLVRIYLAKGEILKEANRYADAIEVYDQALLIIPGNIDLLYARGLTAERTGNIELLEQDMRTILVTEPDNAHALNALGFTLADRTDRIEEAYQLLKRAIEIKPEDPAIIDSFGWVNYRLGNHDEAIRLLKKAFSQFEDGEIAAHLGEVLWVSGQQQEAIGIWKRALKKSPDDPFIINTMKRFTQQ